jgi:hypothetical protein
MIDIERPTEIAYVGTRSLPVNISIFKILAISLAYRTGGRVVLLLDPMVSACLRYGYRRGGGSNMGWLYRSPIAVGRKG